MKAPPVMYVPRDEIDYFIQTGQLPKALAANAANANLKGIRVPKRQDDGTYLDAQGDIMTREDMADYFARLRAAPALPPAPAEPRPILIANNPPSPPPAPPVAQQVGIKGKRRKVQMTLV